MSKRKYTHMQRLLPEIMAMIDSDKSHREIEEFFGLIGDRPIHDLLKSERRKEVRLHSGIAPKAKGRPRVQPLCKTEEYEKEKIAAELQLHSDQGFQYTSHAYFKLTQEYGITPPMSRRENPYDNALAENLFRILKTVCIYRHKPRTLAEADELIDRYIYFYNHKRIQLKTGVAPLTLRHSA